MNILGSDIGQTLKILQQGGVILYPTDTIWGLGCAAYNPEAIDRIARIKGRASHQRLILLVASVDMLSECLAYLAPPVERMVRLADRPLTIIYPNPSGLPSYLLAEDGSVAIRVVRHRFCQMLLENLQQPLTSTSANLTSQPPPMDYEGISREILEAVDFTVPTKYDTAPPRAASRIIRLLGAEGEYELVRG